MSVSSTNLSGNNVTAFNRYRRLAAEKAGAEAEARKAKAEILEPPITEPPKPVTLSMDMTKAQLLVIAEERGVEANDNMTKAQVISTIKATKGGE